MKRIPGSAGSNPEIDRFMPSIRHGMSVLNARDLSEQAARVLRASGIGELIVDDVRPEDYQVPQALRSFTVLVVARITHEVGDGVRGEFDGWFVGEEYHGADHPLLLLPPEQVFSEINQ